MKTPWYGAPPTKGTPWYGEPPTKETPLCGVRRTRETPSCGALQATSTSSGIEAAKSRSTLRSEGTDHAQVALCDAAESNNRAGGATLATRPGAARRHRLDVVAAGGTDVCRHRHADRRRGDGEVLSDNLLASVDAREPDCLLVHHLVVESDPSSRFHQRFDTLCLLRGRPHGPAAAWSEPRDGGRGGGCLGTMHLQGERALPVVSHGIQRRRRGDHHAGHRRRLRG